MQAQRPAQQHRRQGEQLAREDDRDERRGDDQRDRGGGSPGRNVQREQPEIGQRHRGGGHRRDVARHRRHDRDVLDDAQAILAGEAMLVRPGVEIGVAEITHHQLVADLLARQRHKARERQAPDAAIDQIIGRDRHDIDGGEDQPEERAARHHGQDGRKIEHAQCEDRGPEHDQRDRRRGVTHHLVERGQADRARRAPRAGNVIPCRRHADPPIRPRLRDAAPWANPHYVVGYNLWSNRSPAKAGAQLGDRRKWVLPFVTSAIPTGPRPSPGNSLRAAVHIWRGRRAPLAETASAPHLDGIRQGARRRA
jgi:hypothetical protein